MVGGAYVEGWGLYSERLADEMGLFRDERERFGMLDAQAWRAARLVVDTGLHALRWPRQRSIDFLKTSGLTATDAIIETDRYIAWPGQALTYKIGQREIERLRAELSARDGSAFDLRAFHDAVLGHGSLPLATLSRELPTWLVAPRPEPRGTVHASPASESCGIRRHSGLSGTQRIALTAGRGPVSRWSRSDLSRGAQRPRHAVGRGRPTPQHEEPSQWPPTSPAAISAPRLRRATQSALYARALETMPGGTDSNFRAWGEDTIYVDRGKGGMVWDLDGNEYIDLRMGYGPVILGHGDERVDDYVNERMRRGVSFSLTSEDEVRAMELVKELTGWVDKARMTVSGTEATMHAMRIARAYTGRDKIVKFEGQYHGVHDYALISVSPDDTSEPAIPTRRSAWHGAAASPTRWRTRSSRLATTTSRRYVACSRRAARRSPRSSSSPSSGTPRGSCPNPDSTRRCAP